MTAKPNLVETPFAAEGPQPLVREIAPVRLTLSLR